MIFTIILLLLLLFHALRALFASWGATSEQALRAWILSMPANIKTRLVDLSFEELQQFSGSVPLPRQQQLRPCGVCRLCGFLCLVHLLALRLLLMTRLLRSLASLLFRSLASLGIYLLFESHISNAIMHIYP